MSKQSLYALFSSVFCCVIIASNLIFQKFIDLQIFSYHLYLSVGILFYPITFLISDLVVEFYGKKQANNILKISILCSMIVYALISISAHTTAEPWSKIDDKTFNMVFGVYNISVISSFIAGYIGQICDIQIFAYLKKLTGERYLWLRNMLSTICGQIADSLIVVVSLFAFQIIADQQFYDIIISSVIFKIMTAILTVPIFYAIYFLLKRFLRN